MSSFIIQTRTGKILPISFNKNFIDLEERVLFLTLLKQL